MGIPFIWPNMMIMMMLMEQNQDEHEANILSEIVYLTIHISCIQVGIYILSFLVMTIHILYSSEQDKIKLIQLKNGSQRRRS